MSSWRSGRRREGHQAEFRRPKGAMTRRGSILSSVFVILLGCREGRFGASGRDSSAKLVDRYEAPNAAFRLEVLPGGLQLTLGPSSQAELHPKGDEPNRLLTIQGQARLASSDSGISYRARVDDVTVSFRKAEISIRRYPSDSVVEIAVADGTPSLKVGGRDVSLRPNDIARVIGTRHIEISQSDSIGKAFEWTLGTLRYDRVRFENLIPDLERAFDIVVVTDDRKVLDERITATFQMGPVGTLLGELSPLLDATFEVEGRVVRPKHDPRPGRPKLRPR